MNNNMKKMSLAVGLGMALGLATVLTGCGPTRTSESTGQYVDNSAITTKVKTDMVTGLGAQGFAVKVKSFKGDVQLSGFVNSEVVKQKAGEIAANVSGVNHVTNNLIVK